MFREDVIAEEIKKIQPISRDHQVIETVARLPGERRGKGEEEEEEEERIQGLTHRLQIRTGQWGHPMCPHPL